MLLFKQGGIQNRVTQNQTLELLQLLPSVECISPRNALKQTEVKGNEELSGACFSFILVVHDMMYNPVLFTL